MTIQPQVQFLVQLGFSLNIGACPSAANLLKPFNKTFPINTCDCTCIIIIKFKNMATIAEIILAIRCNLLIKNAVTITKKSMKI